MAPLTKSPRMTSSPKSLIGPPRRSATFKNTLSDCFPRTVPFLRMGAVTRGICVAVVLAALAAGSASAVEAPSNVINYPASYFADARPNTAFDMISRLPGFAFDDGNTLRGFAGTAGNVLIDGQRPTSKTDDLQAILQR